MVGWDHNLFPSYNTALRLEGLYGVDALLLKPEDGDDAAPGLVRADQRRPAT